ncbi:MAG: hypothetical protein A2Y69_08525 [Candidatus Aminicenantes bacterium RBG_13_59_9]|nr:MAG: hypothetical protein A2Y69_08525 [Candidatus Aminicenantes bacterium RBG_13_59_9]
MFLGIKITRLNSGQTAGRRRGLVLVMLGGLLAVPEAAGLQRTTNSSAPLQVIEDSLMRRVEVPSRTRRILSLQPEMTRILIALGAGERLVGSEYYVRRHDPLIRIAFPGEARLPLVSAGPFSVNAEMILRLDPDIIFMPPEDLSLSDSVQEKTGKPAAAFSSMGRFEKLIGEIELAGALTGSEKRAAELVSFFKQTLERVSDGMDGADGWSRPRVYLSMWGAVNRTPVFYEPLIAAGGLNVSDELRVSLQGSVQAVINIEKLLEWNPDIILLHGNFPRRERSVTVEDVLSDSRLRSLDAVRERRVHYTFGFSNWWDPAGVLVEVLYLARLFRPERFSGMDLEAEGNAIFKKFYGLENGFTVLSGILGCHEWAERSKR